MTPHELSQIIEADLARNEASLTWHGRPVSECLPTPRKQRFLDSCNNNEPVELWLVFEEGPKSNEGYKVVYSEEDAMFGLAAPGKAGPVLIGFYGGFVETLNSM